MILMFSDDTDYVGCYKHDGHGIYAAGTSEGTYMTPCWCIGYCKNLGYSLVALRNGQLINNKDLN